MSRKQESVTVSLLPEHKEALEQIALEFGMTFGEKPSISRLLRAIANGELVLENPRSIKDKRLDRAIEMIAVGLDKLNQIRG